MISRGVMFYKTPTKIGQYIKIFKSETPNKVTSRQNFVKCF